MVVYEANFLYCRYSPAADILAAFSGRGISRFQRWPEAVAEHPASHASSFMLCSSAIVPLEPCRPLPASGPSVFPFIPFGKRSYALMAGILCGYPMGPKTAADFLARRRKFRRRKPDTFWQSPPGPAPCFWPVIWLSCCLLPSPSQKSFSASMRRSF